MKHLEPASDAPVPEKHVPRPARITTGGYAEPHEGRGNDPRSHRILARLEERSACRSKTRRRSMTS